MMGITFAYFAVGFIVVFIFALNFFNQPGYSFLDKDQSKASDISDELLDPALPEYLTDRFEFNLFRAAFILLVELCYILLVLFLPEISAMTAAFSDAASEAATDLQAGATPADMREKIVLATLVITGMAPNLPGFRNLLEKSKLYLHRKAQIPSKGRGVYNRIKENQPQYPTDLIEVILKDQRFFDASKSDARSDLEADDFRMAPWSIEARWSKLSYLLFCIEQWSLEFPFTHYVNDPSLKFASIKQHYAQLQRLMTTYKRQEITPKERSQLETGIEATLNRSYRLVACLVYLASKSSSGVDQYLDRLGYTASEHNEFPIPWTTVAILCFSVSGSIFVGGIMALLILKFSGIPLPEDFGTREIITWNLYGIPFLIIPVIMVLIIKRYLSVQGADTWPIVTEQGLYRSIGHRPWFIYFMVSLSAYLFGVLVLLSLVTTADLAQDEPFNLQQTLQAALAWSLIVFLTAGYTAFRIDSPPTTAEVDHRSFVTLRALGALSQGTATALLIYFIYIHTQNIPLYLIFDGSSQLDPKIYVMCVIGFFLGLSVNLSLGIGRLRQRRRYGRRKANRNIVLEYEGQRGIAETVNISRQGALIDLSHEAPDWGNQTETNSVLSVASADGKRKTAAQVVAKRGNLLHLMFENLEEWMAISDNLTLAHHG